jgi:hypothetical protein
MQKTFRKKRSSSSKTRKNNSRIKKMKKVVGSGTSSDAREEAVNGLWQFTSALLLFIVAIGIMGNIDKAPDNALKYDNGIRVSREFAPTLIDIAPNLSLLEIENNTTELLLENTSENINNFKDSLRSIAKKYIIDNKELEIVNKQLDEYENKNDNFFMSKTQAFGGKNPK